MSQQYLKGLSPDELEQYPDHIDIDPDGLEDVGAIFSTSGILTETFSLPAHIYTVGSYNVVDSSGTVQTGWSISTRKNPTDSFVIVGARPPSNIFFSQYGIRFNAGSASRTSPDLRFPSTYPASDITGTLAIVDTTGFTVTWGTPTYDSSTDKLSVTIQFNEAVSDLSKNDFAILDGQLSPRSAPELTGWTFDDLSSSSLAANTNITISATPPQGTNDHFRFRLKLRSLTRRSTANSAPPLRSSQSPNRTGVDNRGAAIATVAWSGVTGGETLTATLTFSDANVTNFNHQDLEIINSSGTVQGAWTITESAPNEIIADTNISVTATPPDETLGSFRIRIKPLSVHSSASVTPNAPVDDPSLTSTAAAIDSRNFTVTWETPSFCASSGTRGEITTTLNFNYDVTGVEASDFSVRMINNQTVSLTGWTHVVTGSGSSYMVTTTPPAGTNGMFYITLDYNTVTSKTSNDFPTGSPVNNGILSSLINIDNRLSGVGGDQVRMFWINLTGGITISGRLFVTGLPISNVVADDFAVISILGTEATGFTISLDTTATTINPGQYVTVTATPPSSPAIDTFYRLRLKQDSVMSQGEMAPGANIDSNEIHLNTLTRWGDASYCETDNELRATMSFGGTISSLGVGDFDVLDQTDVSQSAWTIEFDPSGTTTRNLGQTLTVKATPPARTVGIFRIRFKQDTARHGSGSVDNVPNADTITNEVSVNNLMAVTIPPRVSEAFWSDLTGGTTLSGRINFVGKGITNLSASDFAVRSALSTRDQSGFTITLDPSGTTASAGSYVTVTAAPPSTLTIDFTLYQLRLKANSIRSTGSSTDDTPEENVDSNHIHLNTLTVWGAASYCETDNELRATMTFNGSTAISRLSVSDYDVLDQTDVTQSGWTIEFDPSGTTSRSNNQTLTIKATPPVRTNDVFRLRFKRNSARFGTASSDTVPADDLLTNGVLVNNLEAAPTVPDQVADAFWSDLTGGAATMSGRINFVGKAVTNLAASDFRVISAISGSSQPGFTITLDPSGTTAKAGSYVTVTATPPSTLNIDFLHYQLRLRASSIRSTGSTIDDTPTENVDSNDIHLNTLTVWGPASYCETDNELRATMTFNGSTVISQLAVGDFDVLDQTDVTQSDWTITFDPSGTTSRSGGQTLTVKAAAPTQTNDIFRIRFKSGSAQFGPRAQDTVPNDDIITNGVLVNNITTAAPPAVDRSEVFWSNMTGGTTLEGDITFPGTGVTNLDPNDFRVFLVATGILDTRASWNVSLSATSVDQGQSIHVTATPIGSYSRDGDYGLRFLANTARTTGSSTDNFPLANINSNGAHINTIMIWGISEGGTTISCPLTFRSDIINIGTDDFEVIDQTDVVQSDWIISMNPPNIMTRDEGDPLTITGTPPANELIADIYRIRMKANSVAFRGFTNDTLPTSAFSCPPARVNNLETDTTLDPPYLVVTDPNNSMIDTQTPMNNPNRIVTLTLTSEVAGVPTNIENLRADDFVITSDAGRITPTLT